MFGSNFSTNLRKLTLLDFTRNPGFFLQDKTKNILVTINKRNNDNTSPVDGTSENSQIQ